MSPSLCQQITSDTVQPKGHLLLYNPQSKHCVLVQQNLIPLEDKVFSLSNTVHLSRSCQYHLVICNVRIKALLLSYLMTGYSGFLLLHGTGDGWMNNCV